MAASAATVSLVARLVVLFHIESGRSHPSRATGAFVFNDTGTLLHHLWIGLFPQRMSGTGVGTHCRRRDCLRCGAHSRQPTRIADASAATTLSVNDARSSSCKCLAPGFEGPVQETRSRSNQSMDHEVEKACSVRS